MSQIQTEEKKENSSIRIEPSTTSPAAPTMLKSAASQSTSTLLLSADYNPSHNPKKDELVQNTSIKILEVETLLEKLDDHIDKHHRKSSQELQDFEQIHSELSKIQSSLITDGNNMHNQRRNKPSQIDPYIIIASKTDDINSDEEEKDDEKGNAPKGHTVRNDTLTQLEPFQSLVTKIQKEMNPNMESSEESDQKDTTPTPTHSHSKRKRKNSIKVRQSDFHSIQDYVAEHRNKMKEKTYRYEEKRKQLQHAKDRLIKAKARFKKRLNKSKQRSRNRANSDNHKRRGLRNNNRHAMTTSAGGVDGKYSTKPTATKKFHTINENSDEDTVHASLSAANLNKFNHGISISSQSEYQSSPSMSSSVSIKHPLQSSAPIVAYTSPTSSSRAYHHSPYNAQREVLKLHSKSATNSSVQSAFSVISDQSFVDDFHSITAELETIDNIVNNQVKSPSMTSIFSDLVSSPNSTTPGKSGQSGNKKEFTFKDNKDDHIKNNMSSLSESDSKETGKTMQSYCESIETSEAHSLQSDILHLQDIEQQISDLTGM